MPDDLALTMPAPGSPGTDTLDIARPALSATSDMPVVEQTPAEVPATETPAVEAPPAEEAAVEDLPAEEVTGEEAEEVEAQPAEPAKKADPRTTRIKTLEQQIAEERARADRALAAVDRLLAREAPPVPKVETKPEAPTLSPRPKRDAFDDPDAYDAAMLEWATDAAEARIEAKRATAAQEASRTQAQEQATRDATTVVQGWQERRAAFIEQTPDYVEVAENPDVKISAPMAQALAQHERGPELAYWLGAHPDQAAKIAAATPMVEGDVGKNIQSLMRAGIELGKIEAQMAHEARIAPKPAAPKVSAAPPPIKPLTGNSNAAGPKDAEEMSGDEYANMRLPQLQAARQPGRMN